MIFFAALFLAVVVSTIIATATKMNDQQWLLMFFFCFLGLWSGFEFWSRVFQIIF